ncbi:MAG: DUF2064 domain-containing protein [Kiritimatiellaeota bacterium]|nr:DUF2064 domain-containing protein [Kiritimatiellota bacterium]
MRKDACIAVVIPALNEEASLGKVVEAIPEWVDHVVVVDNGSVDATAEVGRKAGARVVREPRRGYGQACLAGLAVVRNKADVVVFLDADFSDDPNCMDRLVDPVATGAADLVIGSRTLGEREKGALTLQARFGNWLACRLIRLFWGVGYTDLGPFRAADAAALERLQMQDRDYGWTVEMQIKAACRGLRVREVPTPYRRRVGKSKISGTVRGVLGAGTKILGWVFAAALKSAWDWLLSRPESTRLVVFSRFPRTGACKTRMIPALGAEEAAQLQRGMTEHAFNTACELRRIRNAEIEVRFTGGDPDEFQSWLGDNALYTPQGDGTLGDRMRRAVRDAFARGSAGTVIIGADCPGVTAALLGQAFDALSGNDLVLGPALDGGYYLIGMSRPIPDLFRIMAWGSATVLEESLARARRAGLAVRLLPALGDVDRPEDLELWRQTPAAHAPQTITVVITALNEEEYVGNAVDSALTVPGTEVIVVDGGSNDRTVETAKARGASAVCVSPSAYGRAAQMNAGARLAHGDALLFLHADARLPPGFGRELRRILATPGVVAGAFRLHIADPARRFRWVERAVFLRSKLLGAPHGDQGLFMKRDLFEAVGGFENQPVLEDLDILRRLRPHGRIVLGDLAVTTPARRWKSAGTFRTTIVNHVLLLKALGTHVRRDVPTRIHARNKSPGLR